MVKLTDDQVNAKILFMNQYMGALNAATGSTLDSNANFSVKNIATLSSEMFKDFTIQINRKLIQQRIEKRFTKKLAKQYIRDIEDKYIYVHDESSLNVYCVAISMYPFLENGLKGLGGESGAPKHLESFCGSFGNLIFAISSQFAGAVATPEMLLCFDHFARQDFGDNYLETHADHIAQKLQHIVYVLNQPAAARGFQSVFFNLSTFDKYFFDGLFSNFVFPNGDKPKWETLNKLQKFFHTWFRKEREKALLTFPVVTHSFLTDEKDVLDKEWKEFIADEMSKGGEFFIYTSQSVDSLSSCCRLRSTLDLKEFSYSMGGGGVMTGSKNVITINVNRVTQEGVDFDALLERIYKYQIAFNDLFTDYFEKGMLSVYTSKFIDLKKQYLTIGVNGVVEAAEFLGYEISNNEKYKDWLKSFLSNIKNKNKSASEKYGEKFNTEFVPGENLGVKNAKWDKADGLVVKRDTYNSYMYIVEDETTSLFDKMEIHGGDILHNLDGGSALHFNNNERLTKIQYLKIIEALVKTGCEYFCENVPKTICKSCGYIFANNRDSCVKCGSNDIEKATRIIGYLKKITDFSMDRQTEASKRHYHKNTISSKIDA